MNMLIKCMLPISLVEREGFRVYINYIDPSFNMPTRSRIKETGLQEIKHNINNYLTSSLEKLETLNISLDGWSDGIKRSYIGFIAQGCVSHILQLCLIVINK